MATYEGFCRVCGQIFLTVKYDSVLCGERACAREHERRRSVRRRDGKGVRKGNNANINDRRWFICDDLHLIEEMEYYRNKGREKGAPEKSIPMHQIAEETKRTLAEVLHRALYCDRKGLMAIRLEYAEQDWNPYSELNRCLRGRHEPVKNVQLHNYYPGGGQ